MRNSFAHFPWVSAFILILALPRSTQADPIVVTGGFVFLRSGAPDLAFDHFRLTAEDSSFSGNVFDEPTIVPAQGGLVDLSRTFNPRDNIGPDQQVVHGTFYEAFLTASNLTFAAEPFVMPSPPPDQSLFNFETPFTMTGHISGRAGLDRAAPLLFSVDVTGVGTATVSGAIQNPGTPERSYLSGTSDTFFPTLNYLLEPSPAPTPEPSTLLLLGSAVVGVFWRHARSA